MVIGPASTFETLASVADACSKMSEYTTEDQKAWTNVATWLRSWVVETEFATGASEDD